MSTNRRSIYFDGIDNIYDGRLYYTDELIKKVNDVFGVIIPKEVSINDAQKVAELLVDRVIQKGLK